MHLLPRCPAIAVALILAPFVGVVATATSIVPPGNLGELAKASEAVVLASAGASRVSQRGRLLFTLTTFHVLEVVSGRLARSAGFTVEAPGGQLNGVGWTVPGSPRFSVGGVYLLFLDQRETGEWLPKTMAYGLLRRINGRDGSHLLAPLAEEAGVQPFIRADGILPEPVGTYLESALVPFLRDVVADRTAWNARAVLARSDQVPMEAVALAPPSQCTYMGYDGTDPRWHAFDLGQQVTMSASATGDSSATPALGFSDHGFSQVAGALGGWTAVPSTSLNLAYGGPMSYTMTCTGDQDTPAYGVNVVMFNDPCTDIPDLSGCAGTLGFGGPWWSSTHTFDGSTWYTITSWFVVLNNGVGCLGPTNYQLMLEHEFGHGLGFGHVADPNALMYPYCCNPIDATDTTCAQYLYPASAPAPTVLGVSPVTGPTTGGTAITVTGTGFQAWATVSLGGVAATGVTVSNSTTITATTGAHSAGTVSVVVQNPDSQSGPLANGFTYVSCSAPTAPVLTAPAGAASGQVYAVSWTATSADNTYEVQESTDPGFAGAGTSAVTGTSMIFTHVVVGSVTYYSRVRAKIMCGGSPYLSSWSSSGQTVVTAPPACATVLSNQTITTDESYSACGTLTVGPAFRVATPGNVTCVAAYRVTLTNGFSVGSGARFTAGLDPSLAP